MCEKFGQGQEVLGRSKQTQKMKVPLSTARFFTHCGAFSNPCNFGDRCLEEGGGEHAGISVVDIADFQEVKVCSGSESRQRGLYMGYTCIPVCFRK